MPYNDRCRRWAAMLAELDGRLEACQVELLELRKEILADIGAPLPTKKKLFAGEVIRHPTKAAYERRRFTDDQIREIRRLYAAGDISQGALATQFKTSITTINSICRRYTYKEIL